MASTTKSTQVAILMLGLMYASLGNSSFAAEIKVYPDAGPTRYYAFGEPISSCVGNPATAQCALDTWRSCVSQENVEHCGAIGIPNMVFRHTPPPPGAVSEPEPATSSTKQISAFRPIKTVVIEEGDIAPDSRLYTWLRPGDVEIEYQFDVCEGGKPEDCTWETVGQENVFLGKENGRWLLIAWTSEAGDIICQDYTPPYGRHCRFWLDNRLYTEYVRTIDPKRKAGIRGFKRIDPAPHMAK